MAILLLPKKELYKKEMTFNRLSRISQDQSVMLQCPRCPTVQSSLWYLRALGALWWLSSLWNSGMQAAMSQLMPGLYPAIVLLYREWWQHFSTVSPYSSYSCDASLGTWGHCDPVRGQRAVRRCIGWLCYWYCWEDQIMVTAMVTTSLYAVGTLPQGLRGLSDILNVPEVHLGLISVAE